MKLDEIIALAKAGYKKKDIDAIVSENETKSSEENNISHGEAESTVDEKATVDSATTPEDEAPTEEDITGEALKDAYAEIERLKKELTIAQNANVNKEVTDNGTEDAKTVEDMVRSFM